jgi:leucine dehydrogenase
VTGLGGLSGDPSPATAWGVFSGIRAAVRHRLGSDDLGGITVAVQGFGHVGRWLCRYLHEAGARLLVADLRDQALEQAVAEFGAEIVPLDRILAAQADVLAPCALGAVFDDVTIPTIRAGIVAGAANNQLSEPRHGEMLHRHGVLYAPDYVVNAGGVINITYERPIYDREAAFRHIGGIYETLTDLWRRAERAGLAPEQMADRIVEERLAAKRGLPAQLAAAS